MESLEKPWGFRGGNCGGAKARLMDHDWLSADIFFANQRLQTRD
jgi:hypothetical protein